MVKRFVLSAIVFALAYTSAGIVAALVAWAAVGLVLTVAAASA